MHWPPFERNETVIGWPVLSLVDWVCASNSILSGGISPEGMPVIAMPPVQRSAVWRPKQVVDLWDSLMRGLPIGTFSLVSADGPRDVVHLPTDKTRRFTGVGFDLLDGQQRVRALLVGAVGFPEERRCLWVDLGAEEAIQRPCLRLTSKAQPFGYDASTGNKLGLAWVRGHYAHVDGVGAGKPAESLGFGRGRRSKRPQNLDTRLPQKALVNCRIHA